jgi:hypothetical protein
MERMDLDVDDAIAHLGDWPEQVYMPISDKTLVAALEAKGYTPMHGNKDWHMPWERVEAEWVKIHKEALAHPLSHENRIERILSRLDVLFHSIRYAVKGLEGKTLAVKLTPEHERMMEMIAKDAYTVGAKNGQMGVIMQRCSHLFTHHGLTVGIYRLTEDFGEYDGKPRVTADDAHMQVRVLHRDISVSFTVDYHQ